MVEDDVCADQSVWDACGLPDPINRGFLFLDDDLIHLTRCLELASKGRGHVSPNPRVGAVLLSSAGVVVAEGYHRCYGEVHAEVVAMTSCTRDKSQGGTLFINLEPCCYTGHTPPCTDAIVSAGIKRVVISTSDPNPKVNGKGIKFLREQGILVSIGTNSKEAEYFNRGYFNYILRQRSWCAAKIALSIDGKMANKSGLSKWITGNEARRAAHAMRADHDGIMVGRKTVQLDNPELTVRMTDGPNPVRIVLTATGKIPTNSAIASTTSMVRTIMVVDEKSVIDKDLSNIELLRLPCNEHGEIDPRLILQELPGYGVLSVLIEGGAGVLSSFMNADLLDEISIGTAPTIIGEGISPMEHFAPTSWAQRPKYSLKSYNKAGSDLITTYIREDRTFSQD